MKPTKYFLFAAVLLGLSVFSLQAQNTEGTEFWLTFGKDPGTQIYNTEIQIRIVGGNMPTSGEMYFTDLGTYHYFNFGSNEVYTYTLTSPQRESVLNSITGKNNFSIHIFTNNQVSVYALRLNLTGPCRSVDVSNILPVTTLGTEYYQISYTTNWPPSPTNPGSYAVVATQNNTHIYHDGSFVETLNKGQVYYRTSINDMTGTCVTANNPVALFSVICVAYVPQFWPGGGSSLLFQQLAPVQTWGRNFFVPVSNSPSDIVRIVASRSGTNITQTGGDIRFGVEGAQTTLTNLQAGQFVELEVSQSCYIIADEPVGVCSFLSSIGTLTSPAQCWLPPIEQTSPNLLIAPFISNSYLGIDSHFALVATSSLTKNDTRVSVGGAPSLPLSGGFWIDDATAKMSYYNMPLTHTSASYYFSNKNGLLILGYGKGNCENSNESYYYLAGSAMRDLHSAFYANDIHNQDLKENPFCAGTVYFLAEIEGLHPTHPERLTWWIDGVEYPSAKNLLEWDKPFSVGEYEIEMRVRYENDETATKTGTLIINSCNQSADFYMNDVHYLTDTTFCNKNVNFHTEIEGLHPTDPESIMWYVDSKDGNGFILESSAINLTEWGRPFENGTYDIKMVVKYDNDETATRIGTLKVQVLWIKMRNIRY